MSKLVKLAATKIGCGYWWGSQGEAGTKENLAKLMKRHGVQHYHFSNGNAEKWIGKPQCFDCSGLILWSAIKLGYLKPGFDMNAHNIYHELCTPVTKSQLKSGDLVFRQEGKRIVHIGVYEGNGRVIEAAGTSRGVIRGYLYSFNVYGRPEWLGRDHEDIDQLQTGTVDADTLNIRLGPGTEYPDIGNLYKGDKVTIHETKNGWHRIGDSKWCSGKYIK